jgi:hypothetical protein
VGAVAGGVGGRGRFGLSIYFFSMEEGQATGERANRKWCRCPIGVGGRRENRRRPHTKTGSGPRGISAERGD